MSATQSAFFKGLALGASSLILVSLLGAQDVQTAYGLKDLNEQMVMSMAWTQTSAEHRELCYQAYNLAGMIVDKAVAARKPGDKPLAMITDLDETVLDNSAYDAGLIGRDAEYSSKSWGQWERAAEAKALPGAAQFLQATAHKGVSIFYISNRDAEGLEGTIKNLTKLGFPYADPFHISSGDSNKQPRFDMVAKHYKVILYMGDNANDMPLGTYGKSIEERAAIVDAHAADYGTQFVALPNPFYGDWEAALAQHYWHLSPLERNAARKTHLKTWVPPQP